MALANKRSSYEKEPQSSPFYPEKDHHSLYRSISSPLDLFTYKEMHHASLLDHGEEESGSSHSVRASYYNGFAPTQYDSSNVNSSFGDLISGANGGGVLMDSWAYSSSSVVSFEREEECANNWVDQNFVVNANCSVVVDQESYESVEDHEKVPQKRAYAKGGEGQPSKKQCAANKKAKAAKLITSKDPQSVAAKVRRERISERLKVLQELVPNGTKVDLVTMLEKATSYVKFLQLQVKVLATDEFWPTQGGKAPNLSQVKDAIDAILCSQRNSSSKNT